MATAYCSAGLVLMTMIGIRWRNHIWQSGAPANTK